MFNDAILGWRCHQMSFTDKFATGCRVLVLALAPKYHHLVKRKTMTSELIRISREC